MIQLTRLNNTHLNVNSDLIKFIEQSPDTVVTLVNGEKILVRESPDEILRRVLRFRRSLLQGFFPAWDFIGMMKISQPEPTFADTSGLSPDNGR